MLLYYATATRSLFTAEVITAEITFLVRKILNTLINIFPRRTTRDTS